MYKSRSDIICELGRERENVLKRQKTINIHKVESKFISDLANYLKIPHLTLMRGMVRYGLENITQHRNLIYREIYIGSVKELSLIHISEPTRPY